MALCSSHKLYKADSSTKAMAPVPQLPCEVLFMIIQNCNGATQKNVRLVSKGLARMAEPLLFQELRFIPNTDCLIKAEIAFRNSRVRYLVQSFAYDGSWNAVLDRINLHVTDIQLSHCCYRNRADCSCKPMRSLPQTAIDGQLKNAEDGVVEVSLLSRLMTCFPNLAHLCVIEGDILGRDPKSEWPPYLRKLCNDIGIDIEVSDLPVDRSAWEETRGYTKTILLTAYATGYAFRSLQVTGLNWFTFFRNHITKTFMETHEAKVMQLVVRGLESLSLSFTGSYSTDTQVPLSSLSDLLHCAKNLTSLHLVFGDISHLRKYKHNHMARSQLSAFFYKRHILSLRPIMPQLQCLTLENCQTSPQDLMHLLAIHSSTLQKLCLKNIYLLGNDNTEVRGCWVDVMKWMRSTLRLQTVKFQDWMSNGGRQKWYISGEPASDHRLTASVERFITNKSDQYCPLEQVAVAPDENDVPKPKNGIEYEGDWTWTMVYSKHGDSSSPLSGSAFFSDQAKVQKYKTATTPRPVCSCTLSSSTLDNPSPSAVPLNKTPVVFTNAFAHDFAQLGAAHLTASSNANTKPNVLESTSPLNPFVKPVASEFDKLNSVEAAVKAMLAKATVATSTDSSIPLWKQALQKVQSTSAHDETWSSTEAWPQDIEADTVQTSLPSNHNLGGAGNAEADDGTIHATNDIVYVSDSSLEEELPPVEASSDVNEPSSPTTDDLLAIANTASTNSNQLMLEMSYDDSSFSDDEDEDASAQE